MPITTDDLWGASGRGDVERIAHHLDTGADVNARGQAGINALGYAAFEGHTEAVRTLLERGADPNAVGYEDYTPLGLAAWAGQVECMRLLLDAGADRNRGHADNGESPLHHAAIKDRLPAVVVLVSRGADVNQAATQGGVTQLMPEPLLACETPLHCAAVGGGVEVIRALRAAGANHSVPTGRGETPLALAVRTRRPPDILAALSDVPMPR